ncbi:helix-turn-helix domain-containing protein [Ruegeria sp. HKCCD8929]|uniref:helix-turn-helix domain-containing protein n=1 Tax=Ruegeria sp. HKCCD8929 TaxID=2683006 RepID=UPI0014897F74|nr:XRE family transcriptional regulator [Ruegeria sp. HKCCD8929]
MASSSHIAKSAPDIGQAVKAARKARGLTLEGLSERTGVSKSMLSAIERQTTNPTFTIVWALTQALGIDLTNIVGGSQSDPIEHLHGYSTPMRRSKDGLCELYMLNPRRTVLPVEWYRLVMKVGAALSSKPHAQGTFEHLTCLTGCLSVTVDGRTVKAPAGDTVRYSGDKDHCINNCADEESTGILLVAQPAQYKSQNPTA